MSFKSLIYGFSLWLLVLLMAACERSHPQVEAVLQQADALMEAHPDSAFSLLDSLYYRQPMSSLETARYALLLAKATDKTYQSLIPCDSLLNFALKYYEEPTADRATALLYKGCLEDEVKHDEEAITHLQEARLILQNYPEEVGTRRITLGLLGDLYYQHKHYEDCLPVYQETLELCETDRDKAITYQDVASYYTMTEQQDSALHYHQEALKYAKINSDSLLSANVYHRIALCYNVFGYADSALYYENMALRNMPYKAPKGWIYYEIASQMQRSKNAKDNVAGYLQKALEDDSFSGRYLANRLQSRIEEESGNYKNANMYLKRYVEYIDSLYTAERTVDIQKLIYDYDTQLKVKDEQNKNERRQYRIITTGLLVIFTLIAALAYILYTFKQKRQKQERELGMLKIQQSSLQKRISDAQDTIDYLQKESAKTLSDIDKLQLIIKEKEEAVSEFQKQAIEISNHYFKQTELYGKITARDRVKNKKNLQILNQKDQKHLKEELFSIYSTYVKQLKKDYPSLKDEDLLLLCLEAAGISNQCIALCLGSIDYHIVYSRKTRMKERMEGKIEA